MTHSLRRSIFLLGAIGILACLLIAIDGSWSQGRVRDRAAATFDAKDLIADILPPPMYLLELRLVLSQALEGSITHDEAQRETDRLVKEFEARAEHWAKHPPQGVPAALLARQHEAARKFIDSARSDVLARLRAADMDGARRGLAQAHRAYAEHLAAVLETVASATRQAEASMSALDAEQTAFTRHMLATVAVALVLLGLTFRWVLQSIQRPLHACTLVAARIAGGDLSTTLHSDRRDAIGDLQQSLGRMQESLRTLVGQVRTSTDSISTASVQIATGNQDLSARTEQAASSLQQTASSMEQLTGTVRQSADSARQANQLAASAAEVAQRGGSVVSQVVSTMDEINASSRKIADIIGVIDGIAFQTNILALNAAVEAARAGEQGRGFAVVASEVRSLAQRSAEAAKEIKGLIGASVDKVENGSRLVADAGSTMNEIVASVQRVSDIIGEITAAAAEQSDGIGQVNTAVTQLDQMTQQNAALVEESAAAAESLKEQATRLNQVVGTFRVEACVA